MTSKPGLVAELVAEFLGTFVLILFGTGVVALFEELPPLGQQLHRLFLVASDAGLLDVGQQRVRRVFEQAPVSTGQGASALSALACLFDHVLAEERTALLEEDLGLFLGASRRTDRWPLVVLSRASGDHSVLSGHPTTQSTPKK